MKSSSSQQQYQVVKCLSVSNSQRISSSSFGSHHQYSNPINSSSSSSPHNSLALSDASTNNIPAADLLSIADSSMMKNNQQMVLVIVTREHITKVLKKTQCYSEDELNRFISEGWKLRHLKSPNLVEIEDIFFEKFANIMNTNNSNSNSNLGGGGGGNGVGTGGSNQLVANTKNEASEKSKLLVGSEDDDEDENEIAEAGSISSDSSSSIKMQVENLSQLVDKKQSYWICFQMEYFKHGDLDTYLKKKTKQYESTNNCHVNSIFEVISRDQLLSYMIQIAEGVKYLHSEGFVHLDLKPSNIFVTNDEKSIKIGDFETMKKMKFSTSEEAVELEKERGNFFNRNNGSIHSDQLLVPQSFSSEQTLLGTVKYCSPEMMSQEPYGYSTDMWSLGCVFYELLFQVLNRQFYIEVYQNVNFHAQLRQQVMECVTNGTELAELICKLLDPNPIGRPTAAETLEKLRSIHGRANTLSSKNSPLSPAKSRVRESTIRRNTFIPSKTVTQNFFQKFLLRSQSNKLSLKPSYWEEFSNIPKIAFETLTSNDIKQRKLFIERKNQSTGEHHELFDSFSNFYTFKDDDKNHNVLFGLTLNKLIEMVTVTEHRLFDTMSKIRFREYDTVANDYFEVFGENCVRPETRIETKDTFRKAFFRGYVHILSPDGLLLKIFERLSLPLILIMKNFGLDSKGVFSSTDVTNDNILEESVGEHVDRITNTMSKLLETVECIEIIICCLDVLSYWLSEYYYQWNQNMFEFLSKIIEQIKSLHLLKKVESSKIPDSVVTLSKVGNALELCETINTTLKKKMATILGKKNLRKKVSIKEYTQFTSLEIEKTDTESFSDKLSNFFSSHLSESDSDVIFTNGNNRRGKRNALETSIDTDENLDDDNTNTDEYYHFYKTIYMDSSKCPRPNIPPNVFSSSLKWSDVSPVELSRQFTIMDYYFYSEISSVEFLNYSILSVKNCKKTYGYLDFNMAISNFRSQYFKMNCPKLCQYLELIHDRANWLMCDVLDKPHIKDRVELIIKIKQIIIELYNMQNYGAAHALATIFSHPAIKENLYHTVDESKKKFKGNANFSFKSIVRNLGHPKHSHTIVQEMRKSGSFDSFSINSSTSINAESSLPSPNIVRRKESISTVRVIPTSVNNSIKQQQIASEDDNEAEEVETNPLVVFYEDHHTAKSKDSSFSHMPTPSLIHFKSKYDIFFGFDPSNYHIDVVVVEDSRYQNYNDLFDGCRTPCLPIVEAHLRELMYIQNHFMDFLQQEELSYFYSTETYVKHHNNMIRWAKFEELATAMNRLEKCRVDFAIQPVFQIQMMIQKQQREASALYGSTMTVEQFIKIARIREPPNAQRKEIL